MGKQGRVHGSVCVCVPVLTCVCMFPSSHVSVCSRPHMCVSVSLSSCLSQLGSRERARGNQRRTLTPKGHHSKVSDSISETGVQTQWRVFQSQAIAVKSFWGTASPNHLARLQEEHPIVWPWRLFLGTCLFCPVGQYV